jgi:hypothetical protein
MTFPIVVLGNLILLSIILGSISESVNRYNVLAQENK